MGAVCTLASSQRGIQDRMQHMLGACCCLLALSLAAGLSDEKAFEETTTSVADNADVATSFRSAKKEKLKSLNKKERSKEKESPSKRKKKQSKNKSKKCKRKNVKKMVETTRRKRKSPERTK